jgi:hypothetical protein
MNLYALPDSFKALNASATYPVGFSARLQRLQISL